MRHVDARSESSDALYLATAKTECSTRIRQPNSRPFSNVSRVPRHHVGHISTIRGRRDTLELMTKPLLVIVALLLGLLLAACAAARGCSCGQEYDRDPFDPEAAFYVSADHDVSDHCYCRCGSDPVQRFPPSLTCEGFEGACESSDGMLGQLACD